MPNVGIAEILIVLTIMGMFVAVAYVLIVGLARLVHGGSARPDPALDALRTRFANGEIDESEFKRLRSVLQGR